MDYLYVLDQEPVREAVDPRTLQAHGSVERLSSLVSQNDKLRASVVRVGLECDKSLFVQVVDDPLNVLAVGTQIAREPRDGLRPIRLSDSTEDLPAGARQTEAGDQPISRGEHSAVEPEQVEDEAGQGIACRRSLGLVH